MNDTTTDQDTFSTDAAGLAPSRPTEMLELDDGAHLDLRIAPVAHRVGDDLLRMLAYNGSIPGPVLRVRQGSEITVRARNDGDVEATVHWHGLCLDNRYDGVPYETQAPIPIGGEFTYVLTFPDEGLYWYHPHIREDYGLDMGLYGTILVDPQDPDCWAPVEPRVRRHRRRRPCRRRQGRTVPPGRAQLRGDGPVRQRHAHRRQAELDLGARAGEVVRFYFVNTANTRVFNLALPGARMKLVGGDSGRYEHETVRRRGAPRPVRASHHRVCSTRRDLSGGAPHAGSHLRARHIAVSSGQRGRELCPPVRIELRTSRRADGPAVEIATDLPPSLPTRRSRSIADAASLRRRGSANSLRVDLSDAPRDRAQRAGRVSHLRDEAGADG